MNGGTNWERLRQVKSVLPALDWASIIPLTRPLTSNWGRDYIRAKPRAAAVHIAEA